MIKMILRAVRVRHWNCILILLLGLTAPSSVFAGPAKGPSPSEWSGSAKVLQYLGQITFGGQNLTGLKPVGPDGTYMVGRIDSGTATGPVLHGQILPAGEDWALKTPDGSLHINVQLLLKTDDGALIRIHYKGRWKGSAALRKKIIGGKVISPTKYYLRVAPFFETMDPRYRWLNDVVAVGYGRVEGGVGVTMRIYKVN